MKFRFVFHPMLQILFFSCVSASHFYGVATFLGGFLMFLNPFFSVVGGSNEIDLIVYGTLYIKIIG